MSTSRCAGNKPLFSECDREATIEIAIAFLFSNVDRDRDRDLKFGDRGHALQMTFKRRISPDELRGHFSCDFP